MYNWKSTVLNLHNTIYDAISVLSKNPIKIILVVDDDDILIGTITDGDIRRALVKGYKMNELLSRVMKTNPITVFEKIEKEERDFIMKNNDIFHLPIVDSANKIVGLDTLIDPLIKQKHDNIVFLMAGGFGKRLRPLTYKTPKPLLKIGKKPIIEIIIERFIEEGFNNFYISVHYKAQMIRDHFDNGDKWGVSITYVYEKEPLGTAGALSLLPKTIKNLPIIVMNGDLLTEINFSHLLKYHNEQDGIATICTREYKVEVPYGVIESDSIHVSNIIEKPVHCFHVNAGIYVLGREIIRSISSVKYKDMPELLQEHINKGKHIHSYPVFEYWIDIGHIEEYNRANSEINNLL